MVRKLTFDENCFISVGHGQDVTAQDLKYYLSTMENRNSIEVKKLNKKRFDSAFSIGVPEKLFCTNLWPESTVLR